MRIQHNIMAMNAYRNYTNNVSAMKKNRSEERRVGKECGS